MKEIAIIDYGLGNLRSVSRALEKVGGSPVITSDPEIIRSADGIVLPGVGAFHEGMTRLSSLRDLLHEAQGERPILGICLGMQMLMDFSEEHGLHAGISLIPGTVRKFPRSPGFKVPHMGWNQVTLEMPDDPLFSGIPNGSYVYFVHSFWADTTPGYTVTSTEYICPFASAIRNNTSWGTQFHPEKSGTRGLAILKNFVDLL